MKLLMQWNKTGALMSPTLKESSQAGLATTNKNSALEVQKRVFDKIENPSGERRFLVCHSSYTKKKKIRVAYYICSRIYFSSILSNIY